MLKVKNLEVYYHHIYAVRDISFKIQQGEIVTLLGANGAGKTTILSAISGLTKIHNGKIEFDGQNIVSLQPYKIVQLGIIHVPEGRGIFLPLTVIENLELGSYVNKSGIKNRLSHLFELFPILYERKTQIAGTLSGGEQQMLAIARALISNPKLLLLDEPSLGLAPKFVEKIFEIIKQINKEGITILLVEQNAHIALNIAHYGYVLETGRIVVEGTQKTLLENDLTKAYLGKKD